MSRSAAPDPMDRFYRAVRAVAGFWLWFLFKSIDVRHPERVPAAGPILLCPNHPNNFIDSLVVGSAVRRKVHYLEKDLGPVALPRIPASLQPFTVAEYFPTLGVTPFHDPRQHAVSLAYVVPVEGDCAPQQDALELTWFSPDEARDERLLAEMTGGQGTLLQQGLAYMGH